MAQLVAPTELTVTDVGAESVDLSWVASHTEGETRIDVREDDSGDWVAAKTVDRTTEQDTVSGLLNGQFYGARVVAVSADDEQPDLSGPAEYGLTIDSLTQVRPSP